MAHPKPRKLTWIALGAVATLVVLLWGRDTFGHSPGDETISVPTTFASLDGGAHDADGIVNNSVTINGNLTVTNGGSITCNETGTPASACPITLNVTGDLEIQAGGAIRADNIGNNGGTGGAISLTIGGDFTMRGPSGATPGALVSSRQTGGGNGRGGNVVILVGGVTITPDPVNPASPAIGVCGSPEGDASIEAGATITSDAASGRAGNIALHAGRNISVLGTVRAEGFGGAGHGGAITLDACCDLFIGDTGLVRSASRDPGPDRVHVEGCVVTIYGVVESTGPAHENPEPNCTAPDRPGKPANSTACVEIWSGTTVVIDSTGTHNGQVNADTGMSGGVSGLGWIDILANLDITINDGTNNDYVQAIGGGPGVSVVHAVHANQFLGNGRGGVIDVESKSGSVSTSGNAIQASDLANGGDGGSVTVEAGGAGAAGDVALNQAASEARGANHPNSVGGLIAVRSFNGDITGTAPGSLNASAGSGGSISLTSCTSPPSYSGTSTPAAVPFSPVCGTMPTFPSPADTLLPSSGCAQSCNVVTPTDTPTNTPTDTPTDTPTNTPTDTPTDTPTNTPTETPTETPTSTPTETPTDGPTSTPTNTPTETPTEIPTNTPTETPTSTPTPIIPTPGEIDTPTPTPTNTPTSTPTPGFDGCTPGYWKQEQHFDSWPAAYLPTTLVSSVFSSYSPSGCASLPANLTLLGALNLQGGKSPCGAKEILLRAAVAALLNSAVDPNLDYPITTQEVIDAVNTALASNDRKVILSLASQLDTYNNLGCPLN